MHFPTAFEIFLSILNSSEDNNVTSRCHNTYKNNYSVDLMCRVLQGRRSLAALLCLAASACLAVGDEQVPLDYNTGCSSSMLVH